MVKNKQILFLFSSHFMLWGGGGLKYKKIIIFDVFFAYYAICNIFRENLSGGGGGGAKILFHVFFVFYAICNIFREKQRAGLGEGGCQNSIGRMSRVWNSLLVKVWVCGRSWVRAPTGAIVRRVFHPTRKLVRFSLVKCPSIPNSKIF